MTSTLSHFLEPHRKLAASAKGGRAKKEHVVGLEPMTTCSRGWLPFWLTTRARLPWHVTHLEQTW